MLIRVDQSRHGPGVRSVSTTATTRVTAATVGPAASGAPAGSTLSWSVAIGSRVAATSIRTVPDTTGVMTRRQQREGRGHPQLHEGADHQETRRASPGHASGDGYGGDRDELDGGRRDHDLPGTEVPGARGVQERDHGIDEQRREDGPLHVGVVAAGSPHRHGDDEDRRRQRERDALQSDAGRDQRWAALSGPVADRRGVALRCHLPAPFALYSSARESGNRARPRCMPRAAATLASASSREGAGACRAAAPRAVLARRCRREASDGHKSWLPKGDRTTNLRVGRGSLARWPAVPGPRGEREAVATGTRFTTQVSASRT